VKRTNQLFEVLNKYKLAYPVPGDIQDFIEEDRKETLKTILKITGAAGLLFWLALIFQITIKKLGISLSILQSKLIVGITVCAVATGSTTGTYQAVKYVQKKVIHKEQKVEIPEKKTEETIEKKKLKKDRAEEKNIFSTIQYRIGVLSFKGINTDHAQEINDKITSHLEEKLGSDRIIKAHPEQDRNVNFMLMGSLMQFGDTYTVTVKVTNVETGKLEIAFSDDIATSQEIDEACVRIADRILKNIKE
jgi:hypothetical protein